jgi:hypothetical protein
LLTNAPAHYPYCGAELQAGVDRMLVYCAKPLTGWRKPAAGRAVKFRDNPYRAIQGIASAVAAECFMLIHTSSDTEALFLNQHLIVMGNQ